jgi:hypothetical protein
MGPASLIDKIIHRTDARSFLGIARVQQRGMEWRQRIEAVLDYPGCEP